MSALKSILGDRDKRDLNAWARSTIPSGVHGGYSIALWDADESVAFSSSGHCADVKFMYGCLQDVLIGALVAALEADGFLSADEPAKPHLYDLFAKTPATDSIQIRHLLAHASGVWLEPPPPPIAAQLIDWQSIVTSLPPMEPRFIPGSLVTHSFLERILLLKIIERVTGANPYEVMRKRLFQPSGTIYAESPAGPLRECYRDLGGTVEDFTSFLSNKSTLPWLEALSSPTQTYVIAKNAKAKNWAPIESAMGLVRLSNGIWAEDGEDRVTGYVGFRLDPATQRAIIGVFSSSYLRDHILAHLCSEFFDVPPLETSRTIGHLGGLDPQDLVGTYGGMAGGKISLRLHDGGLAVDTPGEGGVRLFAKIDSDGSLKGGWSSPSFWMEPRRTVPTSEIALHFGRHAFLKKSKA